EADAAALPPDPRLRAGARLPLRRGQGHPPGRRGARVVDSPDPSSTPTAPAVGVVVPAAGVGRRLGAGRAKALVSLAGRPLLAHAVAALEANRCVAAVVVAGHPDALE